MPVTIDATVAGPSANSYVTRLEADAYAEGTAYAAAWAAKAGADKDVLLVRAARVLDTVAFPGTRVWQEGVQAMQWPRHGVVDPSGLSYPTNVIPRAVKDAQCLLAAWLSAQTGADPFGHSSQSALEAVSAGGVSVSFAGGAPTTGQDVLSRVVVPVLAAGGCARGGGAVRLTR